MTRPGIAFRLGIWLISSRNGPQIVVREPIFGFQVVSEPRHDHFRNRRSLHFPVIGVIQLLP